MAEQKFHQTDMGRKYFNETLPRLAVSMNRLAIALEESNKIKSNEIKNGNKSNIAADAKEFFEKLQSIVLEKQGK